MRAQAQRSPEAARRAAMLPVLVYQPGIRCPFCTGTNWMIGRQTAECASCDSPLALPGLPLAEVRHG